jgi:hypothetical protein
MGIIQTHPNLHVTKVKNHTTTHTHTHTHTHIHTLFGTMQCVQK